MYTEVFIPYNPTVQPFVVEFVSSFISPNDETEEVLLVKYKGKEYKLYKHIFDEQFEGSIENLGGVIV